MHRILEHFLQKPLNLTSSRRSSFSKNNDIEILKEKMMMSKSPSVKDFSSSTSGIILPPIKKYKKNIFINLDKKRNSNPSHTKNAFIDLTIDMNNESMESENIKQKANAAISQVVKNFYLRQKNNGYTLLINRFNNRYYKIGKKDY